MVRKEQQGAGRLQTTIPDSCLWTVQPPLETETRGHAPCKKVGLFMVVEEQDKEESVEDFLSCGMVDSEGMVGRGKGLERGVESGRSRRRVQQAAEDERISDRCVGIE